MLKISASEVEFSSEISAKMLSFLRKGQAQLSASAGKLQGCRACAVSALLDPSVIEALTDPSVVALGADGSKTKPIKISELSHAYVAHAQADGKPLPTLLGGPLCFVVTNAMSHSFNVDNLVALQLESADAATAAISDASKTVVLDAAEVRRALAAEAMKEAEAEALAEASVARAAADSSSFAQLKTEALEQLEEERAMMASREADRMRDIEKSIKTMLVGVSAVIVAVLAAFCPGWMPLGDASAGAAEATMVEAVAERVAEQVQQV